VRPTAKPTPDNFDIAGEWDRIQQVKALAPFTFSMPAVSPTKLVGQPRPSNWPKISGVFIANAIRVALSGAVIGASIASPAMLVIYLYLWLLLVLLVRPKLFEAPEIHAERERRKKQLAHAKAQYAQQLNRLKSGLRELDRPYAEAIDALVRTKTTLGGLEEKAKQLLAQSIKTAEGRTRQAFLMQHRLIYASITGIGPAKKAALQSFGIETAADITLHSVMRVRGIGYTLGQALVDWRSYYERQFRWNPDHPVAKDTRRRIEAEISNERGQLISKIRGGVETLNRLKAQIEFARREEVQRLVVARKALDQASADYSML